MIRFPLNEVAEELITPFVMRHVGRGTLIPPIIIPAAADALVNVKYNFFHHHHQLTLVSSSPQNLEEEQDRRELWNKIRTNM